MFNKESGGIMDRAFEELKLDPAQRAPKWHLELLLNDGLMEQKYLTGMSEGSPIPLQALVDRGGWVVD